MCPGSCTTIKFKIFLITLFGIPKLIHAARSSVIEQFMSSNLSKTEKFMTDTNKHNSCSREHCSRVKHF